MAVSKKSRNPDPVEHLRRFLGERQALQRPTCIALSGGRDSVALLRAAALLPEIGSLQALHVNHGLSAHADAWAEHCRQLCSSLKVPFQVVRVTVAHGGGQGLEAAAREARYAAFAECGSELLLLAHHLGDQAETVLFNLARGSGVGGAAGMPAERRLATVRVLRPWLNLPPAAVSEFALAQGLSWVEDESNTDRRYSRNFLRHEILPQLAQRFPAVRVRLGEAAAQFAEADRLLAELAEQDWRTLTGKDESLPMEGVRQLSVPRLKNLLRWRLRALGWQLPVASRLEEFVRQLVEAAPDRHPRLELPQGCLLVRARCLHFHAA